MATQRKCSLSACESLGAFYALNLYALNFSMEITVSV